jgi:N-acetylglucosaminyl-diphospho-decaprenol L-rhamnosyltransferase
VQVDVVVVAYRSAAHLRRCVEPLCGHPDIKVIVVDNACPESSTSTLAGLPVRVIEMGWNAGFGAGCNAGARAGSGDSILFLNPDAGMSPESVRILAQALSANPRCGAIGPRILQTTGGTQPSMRRGPTLLAAFGEALFLHHAIQRSDWPTETIRRGYDEPATKAMWLIGAALCVRRSAFEEIGGFDEQFFMYSEDADLGVRLRRAGYVLCYEPAASAVHEGAGSTPPSHQAPLRATARVVYARQHERGLRYVGFRVAFALHELLRVPIAATRSWTQMRARLAALAVTFSPSRPAVRRRS